ncbi:hypothetical protein CYY_003783 [Polysphondylium violaceum]|uniref:Protein kinase domain-containing protein n=1 Tax=Polysphondylium violaceum TaxID=133409 RepID=A0A8J4Q6E3_9MYCE|nr:hypothetical protein CYY_003783 [Polysphondylium violaceum]
MEFHLVPHIDNNNINNNNTYNYKTDFENIEKEEGCYGSSYYSPFEGTTTHLEFSNTIFPIVDENEHQEYIIDKFNNTKELASGGEGSVKLITIENFQVVVKRIKKANDVEIIQVKELDSIYLRKLYHTFESQNYYYLVMEYIDGETLTHFIEEDSTKVDQDYFDFMKKLVKQVVLGLYDLHQNGIVHGDIKPDNILWDGKNIKLIDFGHSFIEMEQLLNRKIGTKVYRSPELWDNINSGFKIDIYSLGATLYECFSGKLPFIDTNQLDLLIDNVEIEMEIKNQVQNGKLLFPNHLPQDIKCFLSKLLEKDPNQRPTIAEIIKDPFFQSI